MGCLRSYNGDEVKISDFGKSRCASASGSFMSTHPGAIFVTPPEAWSGGGIYGPAFDMYSYGVVMMACMVWAGSDEQEWWDVDVVDAADKAR